MYKKEVKENKRIYEPAAWKNLESTKEKYVVCSTNVY